MRFFWCLSKGALVGGSVMSTICPFPKLMSNKVEPNPQCQHTGLPCVVRRSRMSALSLVLSLFNSLARPFFQRPSAHPLPPSRRGLWLKHGRRAGESTQLINTELVTAGKSNEATGVHLGSGAACRHRCPLLITSDFRNFADVCCKVKFHLVRK